MAQKKLPVTEAIKMAFKALMAEKPFIDITVTEVVSRAGVARASFYRNYSSTRDIMDDILDEFFTEIRNNALPVIASQDEKAWRAFLFRFIYFVSDNQYKIMLSQNSNTSLLMIRMSEFAHELSEEMQFSNIKEKFRISSRIAVINSTVLRWIDDGKQETPEELVDYLMSFILTV